MINLVTSASLKNTIEFLLKKEPQSFVAISSYSESKVTPDIFWGYSDDYEKIRNHYQSFEAHTVKVLVCNKNTEMTVQQLMSVQADYIIEDQDLETWPQLLFQIAKTHQGDAEILKIQDEVETKRADLEKLNDHLQRQNAERSSALGVFLSEEQNKRNEEKRLLYLLDFINAHYQNVDFLDQFIKYVEADLKKSGSFHHFGFIVSSANEDQSDWIRQDRKAGYYHRSMNHSFKDGFDTFKLSQHLANELKRPVGKILVWQSASTQENFCFYIELLAPDFHQTLADAYITQRLNIMALVVSRKVTESRQTQLLKNWKKTFRSYEDPIHVVDEDFNIIQTNYLSDVQMQTHQGPLKCYQILANSDQPCHHCPIKDHSLGLRSLISMNKQSYQVTGSEFKLDSETSKKYFLLFYENTTEQNLRKTELIQSEKMNTIGNLANHLAHELNNPLAGLKLMTEMMMDELESPTNSQDINLKNDLSEALKAIIRSEIIIKDLSDFSALSKEGLIKTSFLQVLNKTMTLLKTITRKTRIFIDLKEKPILANPVHLQQVLFNLIKNSCEAMVSGGSIKIYEGPSHDPQYVEYILEDTGPGIQKEKEKDLFQPFYTTKKEGEGTGLGLYLSAELMKKMNAEINYDFDYHHGARFILRFKLEV